MIDFFPLAYFVLLLQIVHKRLDKGLFADDSEVIYVKCYCTNQLSPFHFEVQGRVKLRLCETELGEKLMQSFVPLSGRLLHTIQGVSNLADVVWMFWILISGRLRHIDEFI